MLIGLVLGWKWLELGDFLIVMPIMFGFTVTIFTHGGIPVHMLVPFLLVFCISYWGMQK